MIFFFLLGLVLCGSMTVAAYNRFKADALGPDSTNLGTLFIFGCALLLFPFVNIVVGGFGWAYLLTNKPTPPQSPTYVLASDYWARQQVSKD
jgi:hypothetical protein